MSADEFKADRKTQSAVERELLVISEACIKIRDAQNAASIGAEQRMETRYPQWHAICGIGNILRHEYGRVDVDTIWDSVGVTHDLDDLERALNEELSAQ
jgi:uncharacterized protein with HEPN domain